MGDRVRVGICSWADPALIEAGTFYPKKSMTADARLRYYAEFFDTVEINSGYYAIPDPKNALRWVERTPPGFIFHVKAYSLLTGHHPREAALPAELRALLPRSPRRTRRGEIEAGAFPPEAVDEAFRLFRAAIRPLAEGGKLGYVLFQFAPWVHFGRERLHYLTTLRERLPGWTVAVEFRHRSWLPEHADETLAALGEAGLANVIVDAPPVANAVPRIPVRTAPIAVFRLHGRHAEGWIRQLRGEEPEVREKYDYLYTEDELRGLLPEIEGVTEESEQVFVSFNNNNRDFPVQNALMMKRLLGQPGNSLPRDLFA